MGGKIEQDCEEGEEQEGESLLAKDGENIHKEYVKSSKALRFTRSLPPAPLLPTTRISFPSFSF
jgi:hypothetical protein